MHYTKQTCSNKGNLVIYLSKTFNYKVMLSLNQYGHWEGQFMKVTGGISKYIIIGNIYRPPRDLSENYSFLANSHLFVCHLTEQTQVLLLQVTSI